MALIGLSLLPVARLRAEAPLDYHSDKQGKFVCALARRQDGVIFVGTEDQGIWAFNPAKPKDQRWQHFTTADGLGDNDVYALAVDHQGRVWAGQLNHGVSVYNGQTWRNYDVIDGPLGERVFDIAVCPDSAISGGGDVWIATDAGLTRYSPSTDKWSYYTRADGLPSDQIEAIAFGRDGTLYAGTQCDGLAIASPEDHYKAWRTVTSPFGDEPSEAPTGSGLPSDLINDVMVDHHGVVWVATDSGLAWSTNQGRSFTYLRGKDWLDKLKGLYHPPSHSQMILINSRWSHRDLPILSEDYVNCLAEDADGHIWIGHHRSQFDMLDPSTSRILTLDKPPPQNRDDVTAILPMPGSSPVICFYGYGVGQLSNKYDAGTRSPTHKSDPTVASFPSLAAPPTLDQLQKMLVQVKSLNRPLPPVWAAYLGDDWATQGDWFGHYGRQCAVLCAAGAPFDHYVDTGRFFFIDPCIGPHHAKNDSLRRWVQWLNTDNPKTLYDPLIGHRRQSSWDDHGETYPMTYEGPDLWIKITVPAGIHRVSFYFWFFRNHCG